MSLSSEAKQEVQRLLGQGEKIKALTYLHEQFGISLVDAAMLVETLEPEHGTDTIGTEDNLDVNVPLDLKSKVIDLIIGGKKIEAVKIVKDTLNVGLKQALEIVQRIEVDIPPFSESTFNGKKGNSGIGIFTIIFGTISTLLLGIAGLIYYNQLKDIAKSDLIKGRVSDFQYSRDNMTAPIVSYEWNGQKKRYYSQGYSSPSEFNLGENVDLYVNRENPEDAMINSFTDRWLAITIVGGIGFIFGLFTVLIAYVSRRS
jgi:ribosomal protein L7/L12